MRFRLGPLHAKRRALLSKLFFLLLWRKNYGDFDCKKVNKIVFLRDNDKFGDLIVSSITFREAKKYGFNIDVIAGLNNAKLIEHNPFIDNIYTHNNTWFSIFKLAIYLRRHRFDLLVDFRYANPTNKDYVLMYLVRPHHILGFDRQQRSFFDVNIPEDSSLSNHAVYRNLSLLKALGVDCSNIALRYDLFIPKSVEQPVQRFLSLLPHHKTLLINLTGESTHRRMSTEQVKAISEFIHSTDLDINIILSAKPDDMADLEIPGIIKSPFGDYMSAAALVKNADYIVSPDTSIVHAAAAFSKPLLALYAKDTTILYRNSFVWGPNNPQARKIYSEDESICNINPSLIVTELSNLIARKNLSNNESLAK